MKGEHKVGENKPAATAISRNLAPGGGGGGCWLGGPKTASSDNFKKNGKFNGGLADGLVALRAAEKQGETTDYQGQEQSGTSIFDPVLCELAYRWFSPVNGTILDPFAGGSVRGIVAAYLERNYIGIDLRHEQIAANEKQALAIIPERQPRWIVGDSRNVSTVAPGEYDFIFSCPPYFDLELYSDSDGDLSNAVDYEAFKADYRAIIAAAVAMLKTDRFACFVVGDIRDKKGIYRNFVSDTIAAFQDAGAMLYNEAILVTAVGSLPIRVGRQFEAGRKLGKTHQNVLVFIKGDARKATEACGPVDSFDPAELFGEVA